MIKKIISLALSLLLLLSFAACSGNKDTSQGDYDWPETEAFSKIPKLQNKIDFYAKDEKSDFEFAAVTDMEYPVFKKYADKLVKEGFVYDAYVPESPLITQNKISTLLEKDDIWVELTWYSRDRYSEMLGVNPEYALTISVYNKDPNVQK